MKAIDLHIHTQPSVSDSNFVFSMDILKEYVKVLNLNIIAITNHNLFNKENFEKIKNELSNITVFPGVEVDLEKGHMLVIAPYDKIDLFEEQCKKLTPLIQNQDDYISLEKFLEIFANHNEYLLIPHYKKTKPIKESILEYFKYEIKYGEVQNQGKFIVTKKDCNCLVPLLFSDFRCSEENLNDYKKSFKFNIRFTYVDIVDDSLNDLKVAFSNKNKVFITDNKSEEEITIMANGTKASNKLNVILGKRASGKSYLLNTIYNSYGKEENKSVKYIKQFYISTNSDDKNFDEMIKNDYNSVTERFLEPIKNLIPDIIKIDTETNDTLVSEYITSLKENANGCHNKDYVSNLKIYNDDTYNFPINNELTNLIASVEYLIKTSKYKQLVLKYLEVNKLKQLFIELVDCWKKESIEKIVKDKIDLIIVETKNKLSDKTKVKPIKSIDLATILIDNLNIKRFNKLISDLRTSSEIKKLSQSFEGFKIKIIKSKYTSSGDIKNNITLPKISISEEFDNYYDTKPNLFLKEINKKGISENYLHRLLIKIELIPTDKNGGNISGGQRAEFVLLKQIADAKNYDILLIDEPESSFDNEFIKENIIPQIQNISDNTTVFISTHNNTLGMSIKADKVIYTKKIDKDNYDVFVGRTDESDLESVSGEKLKNYKTIIDVMEAGRDAYIERKSIYENLANK